MRWARDEVPTGPVVGASSAGADGVAVVCARAFALPELKSSCATMLVGIQRHQRGAAPPYKALLRKRSTEGQTEPHERRGARSSCSSFGGFVSDRAS